MSTLLIKNAKVLNEDNRQDVLIQDGVVQSITNSESGDSVKSGNTDASDTKQTDAQVIDASNLMLLPGFTDLYTRLREPGLTRKGTIASETRAALAAGFTKVVCASDTLPAIDTVATVEMIRQRATISNAADVLPMAALTTSLGGEQLSELATLQTAGCVAAGQADTPIDNTNVLHSAMEYAATFDMPLFMTPRDAQLGAHGCAHAGAVASQLGLPEIPVAAETVDLARLIELCRETGCRLHVSRLSSARAVNMIIRAKADGLPLSCDVGIHHLFYTDEEIGGFDANYHSAVPFRSQHDRDVLREGVVTGVIDAICSDHAPHDDDARLAPFPTSEPGLSAYDWFMPLFLQLPEVLSIPLEAIVDKVTSAPAKILGIDTNTTPFEKGAAANFSLIDTTAKADINRQPISAGRNHPDAGNGVAAITRYVVLGKSVFEL